MDDASIARTVSELLAEVAATRGAVNERLSYKGKPVADALNEMEQSYKALDGRLSRIGTVLDTVSKRLNRPGGSGDLDLDGGDECASALGMLELKH